MKKQMTKILLIGLLIVSLIFGTASSENETETARDSTGPGITKPELQKPPKTLKVDAKKLLFGKKGDKLKIITTVTPTNASMSMIKFRSTNKKIATVNDKGVVTAKGYGKCKIKVTIKNTTKTIPVQVAKRWVAITWDDGPGYYTSDLLKQLKKQNVTCTFFVVGNMISDKGKRKAIKRMVVDGHEVANHSWDHVAAAGVIQDSVKRTDKRIKELTGKKTSVFRPPGGNINKKTYKCGKPVITWSVDPKDWHVKDANHVYNHIISYTKSGSIVLIHDIHETSVEGGMKAVKYLKKHGYAFVTVSQMLGNAKAGKLYNKGSSKVRTQKILK